MQINKRRAMPQLPKILPKISQRSHRKMCQMKIRRQGSVENAVYQALPSKNKSLTDQEKEKTTSFYNQDGNLDGAKIFLKIVTRVCF